MNVPPLAIPVRESGVCEVHEESSDEGEEMDLVEIFGTRVPREFVCFDEKAGLVCFTGAVTVILPWFYRCFYLKYVCFDCIESLAVIGKSAFEYTQIRSVFIPAFVTRIESRSFACCRQLVSVHFAVNSILERICHAAFQDTGITTLFLPKSLIVLEDSCFRSCSDLQMVDFPAQIGITVLPKASFLMSSMKLLQIPAHVTRICARCFEDNPHLQQVECSVDSTLVKLGKCAFKSCPKLKWVFLPVCIESIGSECFMNCVSLYSIRFPAFPNKLNALGQDIFTNTLVRPDIFPFLPL